MVEAFKVGYLVEIHLIGGTKIRGDVAEQPTQDYVIVKESVSGREVCVNYSAITHVYPAVGKPKEKKLVAPEGGPVI